ncbi:hypothetical protein PTNB73_08119 [Pyrenophora teres f. teres]|nr:hypothetical protein HRS9122_07370 [Pyrenophora teres f. teres]KAE8855841.1 hypothetical protein PTNB29_08680 [Pyrenophora teres f. teres]KAE8860509.1 hypothetical protein PTNB73_08119 [Pyrenophora teres f. teres]
MLEYKSRNHQTYCSRKKVSSRALGHHAIYSEFYHDWDLRNKQRLGETETRGDKCWQGQLTMGNAKAHHGSGAVTRKVHNVTVFVQINPKCARNFLKLTYPLISNIRFWVQQQCKGEPPDALVQVAYSLVLTFSRVVGGTVQNTDPSLVSFNSSTAVTVGLATPTRRRVPSIEYMLHQQWR